MGAAGDLSQVEWAQRPVEARLPARERPCPGHKLGLYLPWDFQVMESVVKNCGQTVHDEVANKQTMEELKELLKVCVMREGGGSYTTSSCKCLWALRQGEQWV